MSKTSVRFLIALLAVTLWGAGCSSDTKTVDSDASPSGGETEKIDYASLGLWDDGPCDAAKPKLVLGMITVFESPVISMQDQVTALKASAAAFNQRGGANGSCIEVHPCDDGANPDQAVACVREIDGKGVVATVNDLVSAGNAEVNTAMINANIPRVATDVTAADWGSANAFPIDASGSGISILLPQALINQGAKKIGLVTVDLAQASGIAGVMSGIYKSQGATFPFDARVPGGTTDFSQFILGPQDAKVDAVGLLLGEQEALQIVRAGQQLDTKLLIGMSLGTVSYKSVADLGDFAKQMVFLWSYPPATADLPVYKVLRADLAASGEASLRPETVKAGSMRSWIGLYALVKMIRDAKMTDFTRAGITAMLKQAKDVPMLGMFGDENWTPDRNHPGLFKRAGANHVAGYRWDPTADFNGSKGNFVETSTFSFDKVLCGSLLGAPAASC